MHFRILKLIATSGFLTALEFTEFVFGRSSTRSPLGSLQHSADPLAGLKGRGRGQGRGRERRWREGRGRHLTQIPGSCPRLITYLRSTFYQLNLPYLNALLDEAVTTGWYRNSNNAVKWHFMLLPLPHRGALLAY